MWMIDPTLLCKQHILGEHHEIHKHRYSFEHEHSFEGYLRDTVTVEPLAMKERHDQLVDYLDNHDSPYSMPDLSYMPEWHRQAEVDQLESIVTLIIRCEDCREKILEELTYTILDEQGARRVLGIETLLQQKDLYNKGG